MAPTQDMERCAVVSDKSRTTGYVKRASASKGYLEEYMVSATSMAEIIERIMQKGSPGVAGFWVGYLHHYQ